MPCGRALGWAFPACGWKRLWKHRGGGTTRFSAVAHLHGNAQIYSDWNLEWELCLML